MDQDKEVRGPRVLREHFSNILILWFWLSKETGEARLRGADGQDMGVGVLGPAPQESKARL